MIRDLEGVLLTVVDVGSKSLLKEAVLSYNGGSYGAAIVMAVAAGIDDLRRKLDELASSGGAPEGVKTASREIAKLFSEQQSIERHVLRACETAADLLTSSEARKLELCLKLRHLCAHASGHRATAEEARETICSVADLALARPALMGMAAVHSLATRLAGEHFFPSHQTDSAFQTVSQELKLIHTKSYPALIATLYERLKAVSSKAGAPDLFLSAERRNLRRFLVACAKHTEIQALLWAQLSRIIEHNPATRDVLALLGADPFAILGCTTLIRDRAVALARRNIEQRSARRAISVWIASDQLTETETSEVFALAEKKLRTDADAIFEIGSEALILRFFTRIIADVRSSTFTTANAAIAAIQGMSPEQAQHFPKDLRLEYILAVGEQCQRGTYCSKEAETLRDSGLGPRSDFFDSLAGEILNSPGKLRSSATNWNGVGLIALSTARRDVLDALISAFVGFEHENLPGWHELQKTASEKSSAAVAEKVDVVP